MKRSIQKWQDSDPDYMVKKLSRLGLLSALRDAKADILELHAEVERLTHDCAEDLEEVRWEFERWASNDGAWPQAVERSGSGYKLQQISNFWIAWKAARGLE